MFSIKVQAPLTPSVYETSVVGSPLFLRFIHGVLTKLLFRRPCPKVYVYTTPSSSSSRMRRKGSLVPSLWVFGPVRSARFFLKLISLSAVHVLGPRLATFRPQFSVLLSEPKNWTWHTLYTTFLDGQTYHNTKLVAPIRLKTTNAII